MLQVKTANDLVSDFKIGDWGPDGHDFARSVGTWNQVIFGTEGVGGVRNCEFAVIQGYATDFDEDFMRKRDGDGLGEEFVVVVGGSGREAVDTVCIWDGNHDCK
jgi:hypothetical protein